MFGWGKKRDARTAEQLARAAAEGVARANVSRALGCAGVQLTAEPDNLRFCVAASAAIVQLTAKRAGVLLIGENDRFTGGIFSFVVSNHLSWIVGAPFEEVSAIVPLELFGLDRIDEVSGLIEAYNRMTTESRVVEALGQHLAQWINTPTDDRLDRLAALYKLCREHVT